MVIGLNKKGERSVTAIYAITAIIVLALIVLGGFGKLFSVSFSFKTPIFLIFVGLIIFGLIRVLIQSGQRTTTLEDGFLILLVIAVPLFLLITFRKLLVPFQSMVPLSIQPYSLSLENMASQSYGGIPFSYILLILIGLLVYRFRNRRLTLRI